ncbi:FecR family protein [Salinimonas chungwhensis]|jgi:transmembrane sensor|uniref:FecR family protein n=1 Tax=Salinimonas chungwhensis TaxID=265425 RepID=UPI00037650FF|nr:FecR domain-containing protein [Salinimonas chungwhensis]
MSNISHFTSKDDIYEQASVWVSRIDRGLSGEEEQAFQDWLNSSQGHRRILFELASLWDDMSVLGKLQEVAPVQQPVLPQKQRLGLYRYRHGIAASVIVTALCFMLLGLVPWLNSPEPSGTHVAQRVATAIGEQRDIKLADGTLVQLNTNTVVETDFSGAIRRVVLKQGEAHFTVAHDYYRPFIVEAGANTVTAIGTAFNMQLTEQDGFELVVTEGKVLVRELSDATLSSDATALINPDVSADKQLLVSGEKANVKGEISERRRLNADVMQQDLAWQEGMIVFTGEPLEAALKEIGRYTPVTFEIMDENLRGKRVAGYFKVGDISGLLAALRNSFDISHKRAEGLVIQLYQSGDDGQAG